MENEDEGLDEINKKELRLEVNAMPKDVG